MSCLHFLSLVVFTSVMFALDDMVLFFLHFRFPVDERGTMKAVVEYFRETYDVILKQTQLPCLEVSNQRRPNYLPMEVCAFSSLLLIFSSYRCTHVIIGPGLQNCGGAEVLKKIKREANYCIA